ncbi:MAG: glycoside hydrolase family 2 protein [Lachnospiraceae bacterium]|nr:glycoside hydrolase family 2 protein [Lachnospiraceae bacterium]
MKKELFNQDWKYWKEKDAFALMWNVDPKAEPVTLPHDAMIYEKPYAESKNAGNSGFRDSGVYHYSKEFTPSEGMKNQTLILHFDGVYMNAQIYINGAPVASHVYGYTPFDVPLNDHLKFGEKNEIRVIVRAAAIPNSRWYSGAGIYRDVTLLTGGETYLTPDGTKITTESVDDQIAVVKVVSTVKQRAVGRRAVSVKHTIKEKGGIIVAEEIVPLTIFEGEERETFSRFAIKNAQLWSAEHPYRYELETVLYDGPDGAGAVLDTECILFGMRKLSLDGARGLRVNGEQVKLSGACIHHDNGIIGASTHYDFHYRQIKRLKELGFNAIRMAHHPAANVLLNVCDELGMYVMDEGFDMWTRSKTDSDYGIVFRECWKQDVLDMVKHDYNHPSVIMYSLGNEIPELGTAEGANWVRMLADQVRKYDTTRYTLCSINGLFAIGTVFGKVAADIMERHKDEQPAAAGDDANVNEMMATFAHMDEVVNHSEVSKCLASAEASLDLLGYNYMTPRYEVEAKNPNRIVVGSETYPSAISENWKWVKNTNNIIGDFVWTGWDYIGESGIGVPGYNTHGDGFGTPYPCIMSYTGDIDITGFCKPAGRLAQIVFGARKNPFICTQDPAHYEDRVNLTPWALTDKIETWTYPGQEGKPVHVEVYSAGDEVELFVNQKSMGKQPAGEKAGHIAKFDITYEPGTIEAVTYEAGVEIGRSSIRTAKEASLKADVEFGRSGRLVFIDLELRDEDGVLNSAAEEEVTVTGGENARVFIGSGNHSPLLSYTDGKTMTYNGRAQIVVEKNVTSDQVKLSVNGKTITV